MVFSKIHLDAINPKKGEKYSPNLHKWIKGISKTRSMIYELENLVVYKDKQNLLYIGFKGEAGGPSEHGYIFGHPLNRVLGRGYLESSWRAFAINVAGMKEVKNFWRDYIKNGRCAIDTRHVRSFVGDDSRWIIKGNERTCQWCGKGVQKLVKRKEVIIHEEWINAL